MSNTQINQLKTVANDFLLTHYSMTLDIPLKRNNRLKKALGKFRFLPDWEPYEIELAGFLLNYGSSEAIVDVLKHELIHYALFTQKRDFRDGAEDFESELRKHGVKSSKSYRIGLYKVCECRGCGRVYHTRKSLRRLERYCTPCCDSDFAVIGEEAFDGTEERRMSYETTKVSSLS